MPSDNRYWIYKLTSPTNKVYIGVTSNIVRRFNQYSNLFTEQQPILHSTLKRYGFRTLTKEILFTGLNKEEAAQKEVELIKIYKQSGLSLNVTNGGDGMNGMTGEKCALAKKIIQLDLSGNFIATWYGTGDIERELKLTQSGINYACRKRTYFSQGYLWIWEKEYNPSDPPKYYNKAGEALSMQVVALDFDQKFIRLFKSQREAALLLGINQRNISSCVLGLKKSAGGYLWLSQTDYQAGILPRYTKVTSGKSIKQFDLNGNLLNVFPSIRQASETTKLDRSNIIRNLKNKQRGKKYDWQYAN